MFTKDKITLKWKKFYLLISLFLILIIISFVFKEKQLVLNKF